MFEICDLFLGSMYQNIFKEDALDFSKRARALIALHGDWYVGENFSYIFIWGSNTVHLLPRIVPDRMVLQEIAYQTVIDVFFPKLAWSKRKAWPKFLLNSESLVLQTSPHAVVLGKEIASMKQGESMKRMHDPKSYLTSVFV